VFDLALRVWRLLDTAQQRECIFVLSISIVSSCATLVGIAGIAPFFAVLTDPAVIARNPQLAWLQQALAMQSSQGLLVWLGIGFVALLLFANVVDYLALRSIGRFAHGVGARLHALLFNEYLHRDLASHRRGHNAGRTTRVVQEVNRTVAVIQSGLTLIGGTVSIALIVGAVIVINPAIASVAVLLISASYAVIYALVRRRLIRNGAIITRRSRLRAKVIAESFAAIEDVILVRAQRQLAARVAQHSAALAAAQAGTPAIVASPKYVLECITAAGLVTAALWIHGRAGAAEALTQLAFLSLAAYRLLPAFQRVFAAFAGIRAERSAFDGIADDLRRAQQRALQAPSTPAGDSWRGPPRSIRLVDVSYRHSPERVGGVSHVSLEIPAGALVGLVGPNGAGKTTLAELILGLLEPDTGRIEIDGQALDDGNRDAWLDTVARVPQQIVLLDATIAENVAFGVELERVDRQRVLEAANAAQLGPVIAAMPDGLATMIGENGMQLSGGQRQRLGIARALYRRSSLLVLDEATNALDAPTEDEIVALVGALRGQCTVILIAHRASTLAGCDCVLELDRGRLVGRKAFAELAAAVPTVRARR